MTLQYDRGTSASGRSWAAPAAAALGAIAFLLQGGGAIVDPTAIDWMPPATDWRYHYVGWVYYRQAEVQLFPLGEIPGLQYPVGTTVGFNDGIPWLAVVMRLLSPILPATFQYIGLWLALCFVLIGWFGARLVEALAPAAPPLTAALGGALFTLSPPLMMRLPHEALCGHFLLVAAILLCVRPARRIPRAAPFVLMAVAIGVHPYLAAMVAVLAIAAVARLRQDRRVGALGALGLAALVPAVYVVGAAWFGYLGGTGADLAANGFGDYFADLSTFIDPRRFSWLLPAFPIRWTAHPESAYLGVGILLLGAVAAGVALHARARGAPPLPWRRALPLLAATGLLTVYAVSPFVTAFGRRLVDLSPVYHPVSGLTGAFRNSGRFIWPLVYVLLGGAAAVWIRRRPRLAPWVFLLCGAALLCEVKGLVWVRQFSRRFPAPSYAPEWQLARGELRHLALVPPRCADASYVCCPGWSPRPRDDDFFLQVHAARLGLTYNGGGVARAFRSRHADACDALRTEIAKGTLDPFTIYHVAPSEAQAFHGANPRAPCRILDGELACVAPEARGRFRDFLALTR